MLNSIASKFLEHFAGPISCLIAILHFLEYALHNYGKFWGEILRSKVSPVVQSSQSIPVVQSTVYTLPTHVVQSCSVHILVVTVQFMQA